MGKSCPEKRSVFTIPQRHIYFILKGRFEVTLQSFPSDIFQLDILWHFQLNIADIPAEELKACLKGTPALKRFLSLSVFLPLSLLLSPSLSIHPRHSASVLLFMRQHRLTCSPISVVDLHLQVLREVCLIQRDYQKFYHPESTGHRHQLGAAESLWCYFEHLSRNSITSQKCLRSPSI